MYTVNPPVGRFHESLWEIANNHLGDGRRYRDLRAEPGRVQPDGSAHIASLIRPGWRLLMPKDAHGPGRGDPRAAVAAWRASQPARLKTGTPSCRQAGPPGSVRDR
jgi:hypothetical protein